MLLRLNDPAFYATGILLAGAMIFTPIVLAYRQQADGAQNIIESGIEAGFDRLQSLVAGPGIATSVTVNASGGQSVVVLAENRLGDPVIVSSAGAFIPLTRRELEVVQGHSLLVEYHVSAAPGSEADQVHLGLFQRGIGQNGWQLADIPADGQPIAVTLTPPQCEAEYFFIGLWPETLGEPGAIQLDRIRIEMLEPIECGGQ
ncbi:hypothetical protein [Hyphobacterium sp.]|uniref:hypothetical protein n=1 Tax=Hyphobacterium sp. TaxID=2004662 RepID=UPI003B524732